MAYDETWAKYYCRSCCVILGFVATENNVSVPSQKLILGYHSICAYGMTRMAMLKAKHYSEEYKYYFTITGINDLGRSIKLYYLSIPTTAAGSDRIWFEDNTSLGLKLDLVKELHLGGFAAWRKGFEDISTITMIQEKT